MSSEITGVDGALPSGYFAIVASRYNEGICDAMVQGARQTLTDAGVAEELITVIRVPGAWELPSMVNLALKRKDLVGVIALGCVIKGETTHDEHINRAVSNALMDLGIQSRKPIGFGLLTCNTLEQAINRSGGSVGNKGVEAAEAVLEMLRVYEKLR
jgi:6,7-dimethyl-8-ribityllumazine synthase